MSSKLLFDRSPGSATRAMLLLVATILSGPQEAMARTFDVRARAYCSSVPSGKPCGFSSDVAFRESFLEQLNYLNAQWRPVDVSFRPAGGDLENFMTITVQNTAGIKACDKGERDVLSGSRRG